jgi:hypothetical protein
MNNSLIIVTATNLRYQKMAERFLASAKHFAWDADFLILTDDDGYNGRYTKTSFAKHIPNCCTSRILLIDADCLATGPLEIPDVTGDVAAVALFGKDHVIAPMLNSQHADGNVYDTFFLVFPNATSAALVSECWHEAWLKRPGMDMPAFNAAGGNFQCEHIPKSTRPTPTHYLRHLVKDTL